MSPLYDPADRGFAPAFTAVDRAQIAMLRDLASADARLVLKGGMAMRVVVGSMRLTKDVDFDRAARDELLPYLVPDLRAGVTPVVWDDMALAVCGRVDVWLAGALGLS